MARAHFYVCEKHNLWAVALRWALKGSGVRVRETRAWRECQRALAEVPASLLALEMTDGNIVEVCRTLDEVTQDFPQAGALVLTTRELSHHEGLLRESGALHVAVSRRNLTPLAGWIRAFFEHDCQQDEALHEAVWDRLPWTD